MMLKEEKEMPVLTLEDLEKLDSIFTKIGRWVDKYLKVANQKQANPYLPSQEVSFEESRITGNYLALAQKLAQINGFDEFNVRSFALKKGKEIIPLAFLKVIGKKGFEGLDLERENEVMDHFPNGLHGELFVRLLKGAVCVNRLKDIFRSDESGIPVFPLSTILKDSHNGCVNMLSSLVMQIPWRERVKESLKARAGAYAKDLIVRHPDFFSEHPGLVIQIGRYTATKSPKL